MQKTAKQMSKGWEIESLQPWKPTRVTVWYAQQHNGKS